MQADWEDQMCRDLSFSLPHVLLVNEKSTITSGYHPEAGGKDLKQTQVYPGFFGTEVGFEFTRLPQNIFFTCWPWSLSLQKKNELHRYQALDPTKDTYIYIYICMYTYIYISYDTIRLLHHPVPPIGGQDASHGHR